jgi:hypothetical protein
MNKNLISFFPVITRDDLSVNLEATEVTEYWILYSRVLNFCKDTLDENKN